MTNISKLAFNLVFLLILAFCSAQECQQNLQFGIAVEPSTVDCSAMQGVCERIEVLYDSFGVGIDLLNQPSKAAFIPDEFTARAADNWIAPLQGMALRSFQTEQGLEQAYNNGQVDIPVVLDEAITITPQAIDIDNRSLEIRISGGPVITIVCGRRCGCLPELALEKLEQQLTITYNEMFSAPQE